MRSVVPPNPAASWGSVTERAATEMPRGNYSGSRSSERNGDSFVRPPPGSGAGPAGRRRVALMISSHALRVSGSPPSSGLSLSQAVASTMPQSSQEVMASERSLIGRRLPVISPAMLDSNARHPWSLAGEAGGAPGPDGPGSLRVLAHAATAVAWCARAIARRRTRSSLDFSCSLTTRIRVPPVRCRTPDCPEPS